MGWISDPSPVEDLPIITPADELRGAATATTRTASRRSAISPQGLLGDDQFRVALHGFMDRWHGKHPIPWDFFYSVNDVTGRDLNWFWRRWFFSDAYIDLGIDDVRRTTGGYAVTLNNRGGMPAPTNVVMQFTDGTTSIVHASSAVWQRDSTRP